VFDESSNDQALEIYQRFYFKTLEALNSKTKPQDLKTTISNSQKDIDNLFNEQLAVSGSKIACCAGCFYCCYIKVDVMPREAFLITDFIRSNFSPERQQAVLNKAKENWKKIEPMTYSEQFVANLPCPLLENGRCSVYSTRPVLCRIHHSTKVEPCKESFEQPEMLNQPDYYVKNVRFATARAFIATNKAFENLGYDTKAYDINAALIECFSNPHAEKRWRKGKSAFPKSMIAKEPQSHGNETS
jgi:Fe-S-cluster containining protein